MNVVTERNFDEVYPREVRDAYWDKVERCLERVFGKSRALADAYRRNLDGAPYSEQILVYHQEPIELAADLAGVGEITAAHQQTYLEISGGSEPARPGWPDRP
jgi:hypothetical protein